jgi:hypothetical protein
VHKTQANKNIGALTLHHIEKFELKTNVMSYMKHANSHSSTGRVTDLLRACFMGLDHNHVVSCVTDSAFNINTFSISIFAWPNCPSLSIKIAQIMFYCLLL